jgi:dienelactone hydrolase
MVCVHDGKFNTNKKFDMNCMKIKTIVIVLTLLTCFGSSNPEQKQNITHDEHLSGTKLLTATEPEEFRSQMIGGMFRYFEQELQLAPEKREKHWHPNYSSNEEYLKSIVSNRDRFKKIIGLSDERKRFEGLILIESTAQKALVAQTNTYSVYHVKWPVLEGVTGTGLWVEPHENIQAQIVVIPDADQSPEMLMGLIPGIPEEARFAPQLAEAGCRLVIPLLIDRKDTWSGNPEIAMTNQPHREFIYRRAFQVGRHIVGYEVQKVLAVIDWFTMQSAGQPVAVTGYGEGGLLALYSGAADTRIDGVLVSGYFQERERIWEEPIYRNVWGLLSEFGDAEIAGMIAPRLLVVEACKGPEVEGPPNATGNRKEVAAPGRLTTPSLESVQNEARKAEKIFQKLGVPGKFQLIGSGEGTEHPGSTAALKKFLTGLGINTEISKPQNSQLTNSKANFDYDTRMHEQFSELLKHTDLLISQSSRQRNKFWDQADPTSVEQWEESLKFYREYFREELIGEMPPPVQSFNTHTKLIHETPDWKGYMVKLDVWSGIPAGGILLIPNNLKPGEQRPLVVLQHGLGGRPEPYISPERNSFGSKLAGMGYIVYAPQNPYGLENFRIFQRMANPIKQSVFSVTVGQHYQTLNWLKQLPFVDEQQIGFYGLSYGGKSAMRIPALLNDYSVIICSGDFNEWVWKTTSLDYPYSYMYVDEYEIFEFDLANTFNYAEMAGMIAPRHFMVERGHWDLVAPDEWVAYEYAKVRRLYVQLGIGGHTEIEFFDGGHRINGEGTLQFLNRHLKLSK